MEIQKEIINFSQDEVIFRQGDFSDCLYIIRSGEVKVVREENKELSIVGIIKSKDFLGEGAVLSGGKRSAHAVASMPTEVMKIGYTDIKKILESKPSWIKDLMKLLVSKLNSSSAIIAEHGIQLEEFSMMDDAERKYLRSILLEK